MQKNTQRTILFLLGPTATGKTDIVINLLDKFTNTFEIISVDSVQIYKDCNVGSGKPDDAILKRYHHHLINHLIHGMYLMLYIKKKCLMKIVNLIEIMLYGIILIN